MGPVPKYESRSVCGCLPIRLGLSTGLPSQQNLGFKWVYAASGETALSRDSGNHKDGAGLQEPLLKRRLSENCVKISDVRLFLHDEKPP